MHALVVGATGLLGSAIARALGGRGYDLRVHYYRSAAAAETLLDELRSLGVSAHAVAADLRDPDAPEALVAGLDQLDLLVHAAGIYHRAPLAGTEAAAVDELMALNLRAPLLVLRAAETALRAAGGQVIELVDIAAEQAWRQHAAYASSKAALAHMVRCLALELAPDVRVNGVAPGLVAGAKACDKEAFERLQARIPAGRAATPQEVADVVAALAQMPAPVTGQILAVDGGRTLGFREK